MDPMRETPFPPRVVFLCGIVICRILPVQGGVLIFSEGASRAKEQRNIFHCVIPLLPLLPRRGKKRISMNATARRVVTTRLPRNSCGRSGIPFPSVRAALLRLTGSAGGLSPLCPGQPLASMWHDERVHVPRSKPHLTKPRLNLSRTFVDSLACQPPRLPTTAVAVANLFGPKCDANCLRGVFIRY